VNLPREAVLFQSFCQPHHCPLCPAGFLPLALLSNVGSNKCFVFLSGEAYGSSAGSSDAMLFAVTWSHGSDVEAGAAVQAGALGMALAELFLCRPGLDSVLTFSRQTHRSSALNTM